MLPNPKGPTQGLSATHKSKQVAVSEKGRTGDKNFPSSSLLVDIAKAIETMNERGRGVTPIGPGRGHRPTALSFFLKVIKRIWEKVRNCHTLPIY